MWVAVGQLLTYKDMTTLALLTLPQLMSGKNMQGNSYLARAVCPWLCV